MVHALLPEYILPNALSSCRQLRCGLAEILSCMGHHCWDPLMAQFSAVSSCSQHGHGM